MTKIKIILFAIFLISNIANSQIKQKFSIIADWGTGTAVSDTMKNIVKKENPDFIITAGDNSQSDDGRWRDYNTLMQGFNGSYFIADTNRNKFYPASGNHDIFDMLQGLGCTVQKDSFANNYLGNYIRYYGKGLPGLKKRYYKLSKGNIDFFFYNGDFAGYPKCDPVGGTYEPDGIDSNSIQGQWLRSGLQRSKAKFKVVVVHEPPYLSHAVTGYDLFPILRHRFEAFGATTVISGHINSFQHIKRKGLNYIVCPTLASTVIGRKPFTFTEMDDSSRYIWHDTVGYLNAIQAGDSLTFTLKSIDRDSIYSVTTFPQNSIRLHALLEGFDKQDDTIIVYRRQPIFPYAIIDSAKNYIMNGTGIFTFNGLTSYTNFLFQIKHRNHISVWTKNSYQLGVDIANIDMTIPDNVYGSNGLLSSGKLFMFAGDVNRDKIVDGSDALLIDNAVQYYKSGYVNEDVDGNLFVDINDLLISENSLRNFVTEIQP